MPPLLSVVIPTYNGESFIPFALESILIQGTDDLEAIVIDDGSSDRTLEIVRSFSKYCECLDEAGAVLPHHPDDFLLKKAFAGLVCPEFALKIRNYHGPRGEL